MSARASKPLATDLSQYRVRGEIPVPALISWLTLAAVPLLVFFAIRAKLAPDLQTSQVLGTFALLLAVNGLIYLLLRNETLHRRGFIALITLLFLYLAIAAIEDGAAIMWLFAYPPIIFYISESRTGVLACVGGFATLLVLFSPLGDAVFETPYTVSFRMVMVTALAFEMVSCYVLDQSRRRSKLRLLQLAHEFEHAAKHDALTNLANRREASARLSGEYDRYLRNHRAFSVLLIDIDLFKSINDTYGHQAGDGVIVAVAGHLLSACRKVDVVARWGGEEFLITLPETDTTEAIQIGERIRQSIAADEIIFEQQALSVTVSIGVGTIRREETVDRLLQRTDEALYAAKLAGRNGVCDSENLMNVSNERQQTLQARPFSSD